MRADRQLTVEDLRRLRDLVFKELAPEEIAGWGRQVLHPDQLDLYEEMLVDLS